MNDSVYSEHVDALSYDEQAALVALLRTRPDGLSWIDLTNEVVQRGSAMAAYEALQPEGLLSAGGSAFTEAARDVRAWDDEGLDFVSIVDPRYPASLRDVHQAPPFLFTEGALVPDDVGVSVVGSREATERGLQMAGAVATALSRMGVSVLSGLAKGIDTAAHIATLEASGRPVGVIGTGMRLQYPAENRDLHGEVAKQGLLISQFWPDAPPRKTSFPMRNATMSGYGIATVVVQAGENSGARIQARLAVEHGRPVILSDYVVESTQWGRRLVGRPRVHVASGVADVERVVDHLLNAPREVDAALESLAHA